jgi:hypothetical protein
MQVAGAWVLWQVAHVARCRDAAGGRLALAGEHLGQRRLSGAVAAHEPYSVTGCDPERRSVEEEARPSAQLDPTGGNHDRLQTSGGGGTLRQVAVTPLRS